jgi:soluble lytic murein transglycosylase
MIVTLSISLRRVLSALLLAGFAVGIWWNFRLDRVMVTAARAEGISPLLLRSVAIQETNLNPGVVGAAGEIGLFQIMPNTAKHWAEQTGNPTPSHKELFRPALNARISAWYLREGLDEFSDTEDPLAYALAYYNAGPSRARQWQRDLPEGIAFEDYIPFTSTRAYVKQIKSRLP